jgi:hypothetical protein
MLVFPQPAKYKGCGFHLSYFNRGSYDAIHFASMLAVARLLLMRTWRSSSYGPSNSLIARFSRVFLSMGVASIFSWLPLGIVSASYFAASANSFSTSDLSAAALPAQPRFLSPAPFDIRQGSQIPRAAPKWRGVTPSRSPRLRYPATVFFCVAAGRRDRFTKEGWRIFARRIKLLFSRRCHQIPAVCERGWK